MSHTPHGVKERGSDVARGGHSTRGPGKKARRRARGMATSEVMIIAKSRVTFTGAQPHASAACSTASSLCNVCVCVDVVCGKAWQHQAKGHGNKTKRGRDGATATPEEARRAPRLGKTNLLTPTLPLSKQKQQGARTDQNLRHPFLFFPYFISFLSTAPAPVPPGRTAI